MDENPDRTALLEMIEGLDDARDDAIAALHKYGRHLTSCAITETDRTGCTCGFSDAMKGGA